ncbi:MAG: hypothetical protein F6K48_18375 [Okeania sp. SIO3H1]|nr:hypothetical protein [Okeania sp. SIO3H1]
MVNFISEYLPQNLARIIFMIGISSLITIGLRNCYLTFQQGISYVKRLHQIPCSRCTFFTGDYRLKCTVHPYNALTETALNCSDYEPNNPLAKPILRKKDESLKATSF